MLFEAKKGAESVTKAIQSVEVNGIRLIDTPGFNDPQKNISDTQILVNTSDYVKDEVRIDEGVSTYLMCLMVSEAGRFTETSYQTLVKIV